MNATDVYVEQLIIGGLVILIAVVLWMGGVPPVPEKPVVYVALAGAAYLVGTIYDRLGDTLLERVEQRLRLSFAMNEVKAGREPFPEGRYRISVLREGGDLARQLGYIRTRMRLARAVATLLPAATIALLAHETAGHGRNLTISVAALYAGVALVNWRLSRVWPIPRTEEAESETFSPPPRRSYLAEPVFLGFLIFAAMAVGMGEWMIATAGIVATLAAFWSWKRITGTFQAFLRDANRGGRASRPHLPGILSGSIRVQRGGGQDAHREQARRPPS